RRTQPAKSTLQTSSNFGSSSRKETESRIESERHDDRCVDRLEPRSQKFSSKQVGECNRDLSIKGIPPQLTLRHVRSRQDRCEPSSDPRIVRATPRVWCCGAAPLRQDAMPPVRGPRIVILSFFRDR